MKSNIHKKETFEDKFSRNYACWIKNNRKVWHWWKRKARKDFRLKQKEDLKKEILECQNGQSFQQ
jgi:hypothetical protein